MKPSTFNHRLKFQRMISARFRRDLILIVLVNVAAALALVAMATVGSRPFDKVDSIDPTLVVIVIASISCLIFFLKYARK